MGIYLGQLPPAEIARLKAELAETLIANFCYPRFYDPRTQSLRMRPVDRAKRQEIWLYLSSVDFTSWNRVDLMSPDFQHQLERLFILFVQRNRSFFGEQGRKRMSDIRMLIGSCAESVAQGLRNHITGQRQSNPPFGSPRPAVTWSGPGTGGRTELTWEQIAASTMLLQQQIQEMRGEIKPATNPLADGRSTPNGTASTNGSTTTAPRQVDRSHTPIPAVNGNAEFHASPSLARTTPVPQSPTPSSGPLSGSRRSVSPQNAGTPGAAAPPAMPAIPPTPVAARKSEPLAPPPTPVELQVTSELPPTPAKPTGVDSSRVRPPASSEGRVSAVTPIPTQPRSIPQSPAPPAPPVPPQSPAVTPGQRDAPVMSVGEDDTAIFEQMRHQLVLWLRVEAIRAGLEISGQGPSQLLELLRQHGRLDETRLQVVSTLLNLSNQVIKTGLVSIIDYKQALMFHLMHTRR